MYEQIGYCGGLLFLAGLAVYDIRWKKIPVIWVWGFGIMAVIYFAAGAQNTVNEAIICMLPGMVILTLALVTREKIGYGDGMAVLVLGFFLGGFLCMAVISLGIMMTGAFSLCRIILKNKEPIPLIPFLLAAMEVIFLYV